jgi:uncharacterized protein
MQVVSDVNCSVAELYLHPIKSCGAIALREALVVETGLDLDRQWMVVDAQGEKLTQRELPKMALIQPSFKHDELVLRAPGMLALHLRLDRVETPTRANVWGDWVNAFEMGALAAQWFSDYLGQPLRLVRFDPEQRRLSDKAWTGEFDAENGFADGFPLLVSSSASLAEFNRRLAANGHPAVDMRRFRPNIVLDGVEAFDEDHLDIITIAAERRPLVLKLVKPCTRCSVPDVNPDDASTGVAVGDLLSAFRADARVGGAVTFGMNAIIVSGMDAVLRVGQTATASWRF